MAVQVRPTPRWTPAGLITLLVVVVLAAVAFSIGDSYGAGYGIAAGVVVLLGGLILAGLFYQRLAESRDRSCFPPPGRMVRVGELDLHVQVGGLPRAEPVVIFENGERSASPEWAWVAADISRLGRTFLFDRPGTGWSPQSAAACTAEELTKAVHQALDELDLVPPYILVGHGLGGLLSQVFLNLYPQEVLGLVLVDPLTGDPREAALPAFNQPGRLGRMGIHLGLPRLRGKARQFAEGLPIEEFEEMVALENSARSQENQTQEAYLWKTAAERIGPGASPAADCQLSILSASEPDAELNASLRSTMIERQAELANRQEGSVYRVVEGSTRFTLVRSAEHAHEVSAAIRDLINLTKKP